jgi:photosystem II stability/assembly factor-like uncharacterized protein
MKMLKSTFLVFLFLINFLPAKSQWIPCQGIEGAETEDIILQDSDLFILTAGNGIFKRSIYGNAWDSASVAGSFWKVRSTGDALFCYGAMDYLYRSLDKGNSWQIVEDYSWVYDMETVDSVVFISYDGILLRSVDKGDSWESVQPYSSSGEVENLFAQEGTLFCYFYDVDSLFKSEDFGENWVQVPLTGSSGYINDVYEFNDKLWSATDTSIYIYNEDLLTWFKMQDSLPVKCFPESFFEAGNRFYCCTYKGLYYFDEQDSSWIGNNAGFESLDIYAGCHYGDTVYVATGTGPFFQYEGSEWIPDYNDLFQRYIDQVFTVGSRIYATSGEKIFYSDSLEGGFKVLLSQGYCQANKLIITDSAWYAGSVCGFLISYDSGLNWSLQNLGMEGKRVNNIAITDSCFFADVYPGGIFRTRKDPIAWDTVPNYLEWMSIWGVSSDNNTLFASKYDSDTGLYRSTDYGTTFIGIPEGGSSGMRMFIKNEHIFVMKTNGDVIYSTDFGITWQNWISGLDDIMLTSMDVSNSFDTTLLGGRVFLDGYLFKMYTPGDQEGIDIIGNLPPSFYPYIQTVFFNDGRIIASPNFGGLWYRDDLMVGIKEDDLGRKHPSGFLQLFPNPVREILTIDLKGNDDQSEYLIFDQLGRVIKRGITDKDHSQATIDVSGLPPGVYFVVIRDDNGGYRPGKFVKVE